MGYKKNFVEVHVREANRIFFFLSSIHGGSRLVGWTVADKRAPKCITKFALKTFCETAANILYTGVSNSFGVMDLRKILTKTMDLKNRDEV